MLSLVGRPVAINPDSALKNHAREHGWEIRDFRTGRKAAKVGVPSALGVGAVAGGIATGVALRRRFATPPPPPFRRLTRPASRTLTRR
jgi:hypothetical protein